MDPQKNTYVFDSYTDQLMLQESFTLSRENKNSVLLNPYVFGAGWHNSIRDLLYGETEVRTYSRYWQGFRILYRPMLIFGNYITIRETMAAVFFTLLSLTIAVTAKKRGILRAMMLGVGIVVVNPAIISHCLQFTCDFILAFIFSLIIMYNKNHARYPLLFCLFGALTQYFDFYTVPVITLAFPALLALSDTSARASELWKRLFSYILCWLYGYVLLWLLKNLYVTLFTGENGLLLSFESFFYRIGIDKRGEAAELYDPVSALKVVWRYSVGSRFPRASVFALMLMLAASTICLLKKHGRDTLLSSAVFLGVAALPVIWIICSAQPIIVHSYFQYRGISAFFAGCGLYIVQPFIIKNQPVRGDSPTVAD